MPGGLRGPLPRSPRPPLQSPPGGLLRTWGASSGSTRLCTALRLDPIFLIYIFRNPLGQGVRIYDTVGPVFPSDTERAVCLPGAPLRNVLPAAAVLRRAGPPGAGSLCPPFRGGPLPEPLQGQKPSSPHQPHSWPRGPAAGVRAGRRGCRAPSVRCPTHRPGVSGAEPRRASMSPGPAGLCPLPTPSTASPVSKHTPGGGESDSFIPRPRGEQ